MRYKSFVWPNNPSTYEITFERKMAVNKVPFGRFFMDSLGMTCRVLRGEGEFVGESAYQQFSQLASVFYDETPGTLVHPVWQTTKAYFVKLRLKQVPLKDYVSYEFEFWEPYDGYNATIRPVEETPAGGNGTGGVYIVKSGDSLWAIAVRYNVTVAALMQANPQIKNPNLIYPGDRIVIPGGGLS